jgi:hypothetical protein
MKDIEYKQQIILEFNAYTGVLNFDKNINLTFNPDVMNINYVVRHNMTAPTNTGLASLYCNLPIKNNYGPLFTISQQNDHIDPKSSFEIIKPVNINGTYSFNFVLSGSNGAPLLDADIAVFFEFVKYREDKK